MMYNWFIELLDLKLFSPKGYNFTPKDIADENTAALTYHRIVEAFKFGYAKRTNMADEDFFNVTEVVS